MNELVIPLSLIHPWKGGATVSPRWRGRWPVRGQAPIVAYGKTREEAREVLRAKVARHLGEQEPVPDSNSMRVLLERWLDEKQAGEISYNTMRWLRKFARLDWLPSFGELPAEQLRAHHVQDMIRRARERGAGPKTIQDSLGALRQALKWLRAMDLIAINPLADNPPLITPQRAKHRIHRLTAAQFIEFLRRQGESRWEPLWAFGGSSGVSMPSEVAALRWSDLEGRGLTVERSLRLIGSGPGGQQVVPLLKSKDRYRTIVLSDFALAALERQRALQVRQRARAELWGSGNYIFTTELGTPIAPTTMRQAWHEALLRAELPVGSVKMYSLRATAGRMIYRSTGKDINLTQLYLGHSKGTDTTFKHYVGADEGDTLEAAQGIDLELGRVLELPAQTSDSAGAG